MLIEVGKTYLDRTGSICKVVSYTRGYIVYGTDEYFTYFPIEDGKENRERAFQVDRYGSHSGAENIYDLVMEYKMPDLQWVWCSPDKVGLWACGGHTSTEPPSLKSGGVNVHIIHSFSGVHYHMAWRCYLGPIPQISQPKKLVKQTLWLVKYHADLIWKEIWLPDEEVPKTISCQDVVHKTCTTRTV